MSKTKIEKLTPEQEAKFPEYVKTWIDIGLSTEPMDFEKAKSAMADAYTVAGSKPPSVFLAAKSPVDAIDVMIERSGGKPSDYLGGFIYGQHDAGWLSFYSFFKDEVGIKEAEKLEPLMRVAKSCGWVLPYENVCIICDRPSEIHLDAQGSLHRIGEAALKYRDGFSIYSVNGTTIPKEWGETSQEEWKPEWLMQTNNSELRRVLFRVVGYSKVMSALGSTLIHKDGDMELRKLKGDVDVEPVVLLKVVCPSTGAFYALRVDPSMTDCETARRSTFAMREGESFDIET